MSWCNAELRCEVVPHGSLRSPDLGARTSTNALSEQRLRALIAVGRDRVAGRARPGSEGESPDSVSCPCPRGSSVELVNADRGGTRRGGPVIKGRRLVGSPWSSPAGGGVVISWVGDVQSLGCVPFPASELGGECRRTGRTLGATAGVLGFSQRRSFGLEPIRTCRSGRARGDKAVYPLGRMWHQDVTARPSAQVRAYSYM